MELKPENMEHREWVALQWLRTYLLFEGVFPAKKLPVEFKQLYSSREQTAIFGTFKIMFFFNMLSTTFLKEKYTDGSACQIK